MLHLVFIYFFQKHRFKNLDFFNRLIVLNQLRKSIVDDTYEIYNSKSLSIVDRLLLNFSRVHKKYLDYKQKNSSFNTNQEKVQKYENDFKEYKKKLLTIINSIVNLYNQRFYEPDLFTYSNKIPINFKIFDIQNYSIY